jgi:hypothetical protein
MTNWEYKVMKTDRSFWSGKDKTDHELFLNNLGREGWELISVIPLSQMGGGTTTNLQFFFKRSRF